MFMLLYHTVLHMAKNGRVKNHNQIEGMILKQIKKGRECDLIDCPDQAPGKRNFTQEELNAIYGIA